LCPRGLPAFLRFLKRPHVTDSVFPTATRHWYGPRPNCVIVPRVLSWASTRRGFSGDSSNDALCIEIVCGEDAGNAARPSRISSTVVWQRIRCRAPAAVPAGSRRWIVPPDVAHRSRAALPGSSDAGRPMSPARWCPSPPRRISLATTQPGVSYPSRRQESKSGWRVWPGICGC
jgi:hypothetical protein